MHYFFILFIFLFSPFSYGKWTLSRNYGDVSIYKSSNSTRLTVSFKDIPPQSFNLKKAVKKTKEQKRRMLSMMGLENWDISSHHVTKKGDTSKLYLRGTYNDSKNRKVHFVEHHYYTQKGTLQMLLTHQDSSVLERDSQETALGSIRKKYEL